MNKMTDEAKMFTDFDKKYYLVKTFSRTKRKDFENYIINAIWQKLDNLDIQPVTQQYVNRGNGKFALIDLFFPQLNFGVEVDEKYHKNNIQNDKMRMEDIISSVEDKSLIIRRVDADKSIEEIHSQIDEVVAEINKYIDNIKPKPWDLRDADDILKENFILKVKDNLQFKKISSAINCFGKNVKGWQNACCDLDSNNRLFFVKLSIKKGDEIFAVSKGWLNSLSADWNQLYESNATQDNIYSYKNNLITFAKSRDALGRDGYRFVGVYKFDKNKSNKNLNVYNRILEEIDIRDWR